MSKKITFLLLHLNYGGLEKQTVTLINELAKNEDYDINLVVVYDILGKSFYKLNDKVKIKYLLPYGPNKKEIKESFKKFKIISFFRELFKGIKIVYLKSKLMKKEISLLDTDIIISSRIEFAKLIKRKDTLNITQEHSYINTFLYSIKARRAFKNIDYVIVMTKKAKGIYVKWLKNLSCKVKNIPNMININDLDSEYDNDKNKNKNQILAVGRLEDVKRFDLLIHIFNEFSKRNKEYVLKIIGDGSRKQELLNLVYKLDLNDKVIFTGKLKEEEVYNEMKNSKMFCLTSSIESFSLVLIEAMNFGLPCISFNVDVGPREIIKNNENGFLCINNDLNEYIDIMIRLVNDCKLYNKISDNAKKTANNYYSENIIKEWEKLFN